MLSTENLYKSYGQLPILKGVSLSVDKGEILAITGTSGAGKSTLLHIMGTLDTPDKGKVWIDGKDVFAMSSRKLAQFRNQRIGFVFQFHHLLPEFTALENAAMPAWIAGLSKREANKRAEAMLDRVGLLPRAQHKPHEMSGGEQQRVAIARALINQPAIVLADEPTGNLDSQNAEQVFNLIRDLQKEFAQTFVLVTHNPDLANRSDRILHMSDGKTV